MVAVANIRCNVQAPFPALVVGGGGITVAKQNGVWTIAPASGGSLAATSAPNIWTAPQTFNDGVTLNNTGLQINVANSINSGLTIFQSLTGVSASPLNVNLISLADIGTNVGANFLNGLLVQCVLQSATNQGGRQAILGVADLTTITSSSNTNRNYVGVAGIGQASANDNGTGLTVGTAAGAVFGISGFGQLTSGATDFLNATGAEFNVSVGTGASVALKSCLQISAFTLDRVQGSVVDTMLWAYNQSASNPGWNTGLLFDNGGGDGVWPIISTGTIIKTGGGGTAANGIDLSNTTFSGDAYKSNGFSVDGSGNIISASITAGGLVSTGFLATPAPTTLTGTSGAATTGNPSIIINSSGTFTLTLPSPSASTGQWLYLKNAAAHAVNSASSNVVPLGSTTAGSAIFGATAADWALLQSNGTNWILMAGVTT